MADWKIDLSQNSGVVPPMWNMESGGSKPTNLSKEQVLANALNDYRANLPKLIEKYIITKDIELSAWNGNEDIFVKPNSPQPLLPKVKFKKGDIVDGFIMPNQFQSEPPSYLVITDKTKSDAMFRFANGGRGFKGYDFIEKIQENSGNSDAQKPTTVIVNETFLQKHKNHIIFAIVLVAGYFAYKKFKK